MFTSNPAAARAADLDGSKTCLLDVIVAVPGLSVEICRFPSLRHMRLTSHAMKDAVHAAVQGYVLKLKPHPQPDDAGLVACLNKFRLRRLHVIVPDISVLEGGLDTVTDQLTAQLSVFTTATYPAISSITHLTITIALPSQDYNRSHSVRATTGMLIPLTVACPKLEQLCVIGWTSPLVLMHFGLRCPKLVSFQATLTDLWPQSLKHLSKHLSNLTTLTALPNLHSSSSMPSTNYLRYLSNVEPRCLEVALCDALEGSPNLLSLNAGSQYLTEAIWKSLPAGLQCLSSSIYHFTSLDNWTPHTGLRKLEVVHLSVYLPFLLQLLDLAPNATIIHTSREDEDTEAFVVGCAPSDAQDLKSVDDRLQAGTLQLLSKTCVRADGGPDLYVPGLVIFAGQDMMEKSKPATDTVNDTDNAGDEVVINPIGAFMGTHVSGPLRSFIAVALVHDETEWKKCACLSHIRRVFPNMAELTIDSFDACSAEDWSVLAGCGTLRALSLMNMRGLTEREVSQLCLGSESLQDLRLVGCEDVSLEWGREVVADGGVLFGVAVHIVDGQGSEADDGDEEDEED